MVTVRYPAQLHGVVTFVKIPGVVGAAIEAGRDDRQVVRAIENEVLRQQSPAIGVHRPLSARALILSQAAGGIVLVVFITEYFRALAQGALDHVIHIVIDLNHLLLDTIEVEYTTDFPSQIIIFKADRDGSLAADVGLVGGGDFLRGDQRQCHSRTLNTPHPAKFRKDDRSCHND